MSDSTDKQGGRPRENGSVSLVVHCTSRTGVRHYAGELVHSFYLQFKQSFVLAQLPGRAEFNITPPQRNWFRRENLASNRDAISCAFLRWSSVAPAAARGPHPGFSHGDFGLVQTFDDAAGEQFLSAEIVKDEFAMRA
jgi:hypothetical protein